MNRCRVCLSTLQEENSVSIFDLIIIESSFSISDIIFLCCDVKVKENDCKPQRICFTCLEEVKIAYTLKEKCKKSEKSLNEALNAETNDDSKCEYKDYQESIQSASDDNEEVQSKFELIEDGCETDDVALKSAIKVEPLKEEINEENIETQIIDSEGEDNEALELVCSKDKCKFTTTNETAFENHLLAHRAKEKCMGTNKCPDCNKYFLRASNLIPHWVDKHGRERPKKIREKKPRIRKPPAVSTVNICEICGNTYKSRFNLVQHINTHTKEREFKCKICGKSLTSSSALFIHIRINHGERDFVCEQCGASFKLRTRLTNHMRSHINAREYKCEDCDKAFNKPTLLREHVRIIHKGIRKYVCEICSRQFGKGYALKTHMRVHTKEKPYVCQICDLAFSQNVSLKTHLKKHADSTVPA